MNIARFERSRDLELIRSIITHPSVYDHATDDYAPEPRDFEVNDDPRIWYVLAKSSIHDVLYGLLSFLGQSTVLWEIHCCLLPTAYGKAAIIASESFQWVFANTSARRIIASIPFYNRLAIKCASAAGMTQFGINPQSFMKDGILHDLVLYGISKD